MEQFTQALIFAAEAHDGQTYGDKPYILHPVEVAVALLDAGAEPVEVVAGLLHDVVEDTAVSMVMIEASFGYDVAAIVAGLTHDDEITYEEYVESMPERSRRVKFFDSLCNYKGLSNPYLRMSDEKKGRLAKRYESNLAVLYPYVRDMGLSLEDRLLVERICEAAAEAAVE